MNNRVLENQLAIECRKKTLRAEYGDRLTVVDDDPDTITAIQTGVIPITYDVFRSSKIPQRRLKHVIVSGVGETEIDNGDAKVAAGCMDAVQCMQKYLGIEAEQPAQEPQPVTEPIVQIVAEPAQPQYSNKQYNKEIKERIKRLMA